jgi:hypothetical protein
VVVALAMAALGAVRQGQQIVEYSYTPAPRVERRFDELPETSRLTANGRDVCDTEDRKSEHWRRRRARWGHFAGF